MFHTVANKNGTIEVNGNDYRFSQPIDDYKTEDTIEIENSYRRKLEFIGDDPHYITAHNVELRNGQVTFEYNLQDIKMFDYLRTLFFKQKIHYYRSLVEIAKRAKTGDVKPLWQKENFVIDTNDQAIKALIVEHEQFPILDEKDPLISLKELIIISLTTMNRVLGKPRRADFLEQTEQVIHFAEKVYLKARTIEEIEEFVNAEIYRIEMKRKEEEAQQAQKGKMALLKEKVNSKGRKQSKSKQEQGNQELLSKLQNSDESSKLKKKLGKKQRDVRLFIGIGAVIAAAFALNLLLTNANENHEASANDEETEEEAPNQDEQIVELYRNSFFEDEETTIEKLEEIGYENLESDEDRKILEHLYISTGEYATAFEYNPNRAGDITEHMYYNQNAELLNDFVSTLEIELSPEVKFYQALANENWEVALEEQANLELDENKSNLILTAYFQQENVAGAGEFLTSIEPTEPMQERLTLAQEKAEEIEIAQNDLSDLEDDLDNADDDDEEDDINDDIDRKKQQIEDLKSELQSI